MTLRQIEMQIEDLQTYEELIEELRTEAEAIRDELKNEMLDRGTEELNTGRHIIRWTSVSSNRFDSSSFKKVYAELYKAYTKQVSSKRFTISA